jgi:hypothetical protein
MWQQQIAGTGIWSMSSLHGIGLGVKRGWREIMLFCRAQLISTRWLHRDAINVLRTRENKSCIHMCSKRFYLSTILHYTYIYIVPSAGLSRVRMEPGRTRRQLFLLISNWTDVTVDSTASLLQLLHRSPGRCPGSHEKMQPCFVKYYKAYLPLPMKMLLRPVKVFHGHLYTLWLWRCWSCKIFPPTFVYMFSDRITRCLFILQW